MELIKYQGGPMDRKYDNVVNAAERMTIRVAEPTRFDPSSWDVTQVYSTMLVKHGDYVRSNKKLKNGTPIYVWLGWRE